MVGHQIQIAVLHEADGRVHRNCTPAPAARAAWSSFVFTHCSNAPARVVTLSVRLTISTVPIDALRELLVEPHASLACGDQEANFAPVRAMVQVVPAPKGRRANQGALVMVFSSDGLPRFDLALASTASQIASSSWPS